MPPCFTSGQSRPCSMRSLMLLAILRVTCLDVWRPKLHAVSKNPGWDGLPHFLRSKGGREQTNGDSGLMRSPELTKARSEYPWGRRQPLSNIRRQLYPRDIFLLRISKIRCGKWRPQVSAIQATGQQPKSMGWDGSTGTMEPLLLTLVLGRLNAISGTGVYRDSLKTGPWGPLSEGDLPSPKG
jgi:hypothetical protein